MAIVLKDRVKQSAAAPGTGTITLGATATGFQAFSAIGNGNVTYFAIVDSISGAWEVNYGTYTSSGTTLSRNATPLSSSNAGALVNFVNSVDVFCTYPSEKAIYEETTGNVLIDGGPITVVGTGVTSYTTFGAALAELYANVNSYAQMYAQNLDGGSSASTDIVAYNNLGDGTYNFIDMGIASSNYSDATYPIFTAGSGYVYNDGGELIIGTGTASKDVLLFAGGVATTNWAARISGTNQSITTKAGLTVGAALTGVGGSFTSPVTTSSSMSSPGSTEFVTRSYVDTTASTAFVVHPAVVVVANTYTGTNSTYNNGASGVGATLTSTVNGALSIDGVSPSVGNRILLRAMSTAAYNGVYTVTATGSPSTVWVLTRATDFDTAAPGEIANNAYFYITGGATYAGYSYVLSQTATITVGTTALPFDLFSSAQVYVGGTNIDITGTTISLTGTVAPTNGGTGVNTVATGDLLYGSAANTWSKLAVGSAYRSLVMNGAGTLPEWNAVALNQSGAVSGALGATNGGTGITAYNVGEMIYSNTTTTFDVVTRNTTTTKKFLTQTGTGSAAQAPVWGTISGSDVSGNISGSAGSVANALTLGTYLTGTSFNGSAAVTATVDATSANTASKVVARDVSGNFSAGTITATLSGAATSATTATNIAGGAANQIPYQTGAGATSFITAASGTNYVLNYTGSAFSWVAGTISGVALGSNLNALTLGTYLTGTSYNGSATVTAAVDATSANTASKVVARDASGNFSAGTITAALTGNATTATTATNVSGTVAVANGGTGATSASITAFNNITGYTAAGATGTTSTNLVFSTSPTLVTPLLGTPTSGILSNCTVDGTDSVGFRNVPQNAQTGSYTLVLADSGKHIYHAVAAGAATYTIPANSSVAYPIGTALSFVNLSTTSISIAITTDTMYLGGTGTTGTRTLANYGTATALKVTSTVWIITGSALT